jgi:pimeloyl-ACP methyl ester carboxylesterase
MTALAGTVLLIQASGSVNAAVGDSVVEQCGKQIEPFFKPSAGFASDFGKYKSPLIFEDGSRVRTAADWQKRRQEILQAWHKLMEPWPPLLERPKLDYLKTERRESFTQHRVRVQIASEHTVEGWLLVPDGKGPFPAVFVPYYEPETSVGLSTNKLRDFAYQLTKRGFVTLSIGSPGGDARKPDPARPNWQPLSFLAYVAANCHTALAQLPQVDPKRIGIVGHSYGGKWAMFASCLYDKFACAAWSDPGIVFDEARGNVNYWEPWYLGRDLAVTRKAGLVKPDNPRTGAYKVMMETGRDLQELHALMAPRPFLVSGGAEDQPARWVPLNHAIAVNKLLGFTNRVAMTNREGHSPTEESNEQLYAFFEYFLKMQR